MTIDVNRLKMRSSSKFYSFYLRCTSRFSDIVIALQHSFGHPLYSSQLEYLHGVAFLAETLVCHPFSGKISLSTMGNKLSAAGTKLVYRNEM